MQARDPCTCRTVASWRWPAWQQQRHIWKMIAQRRRKIAYCSTQREREDGTAQHADPWLSAKCPEGRPAGAALVLSRPVSEKHAATGVISVAACRRHRVPASNACSQDAASGCRDARRPRLRFTRGILAGRERDAGEKISAQEPILNHISVRLRDRRQRAFIHAYCA